MSLNICSSYLENLLWRGTQDDLGPGPQGPLKRPPAPQLALPGAHHPAHGVLPQVLAQPGIDKKNRCKRDFGLSSSS